MTDVIIQHLITDQKGNLRSQLNLHVYTSVWFPSCVTFPVYILLSGSHIVSHSLCHILSHIYTYILIWYLCLLKLAFKSLFGISLKTIYNKTRSFVMKMVRYMHFYLAVARMNTKNECILNTKILFTTYYVMVMK